MMLRQYKLKSESEVMVAWLEDGRAKCGDSVTLKDLGESKLWKVVEAYRAIDSKNLHDQHESAKTFESIEARATKKEQRKKV